MKNNFSEVDKVLEGSITKASENEAAKKTKKFRPSHRPSMAILQVFDDGSETCETLRIRDSTTTIGRAQCDVCIPHDDLIASKHLEIVRAQVGSQSLWSIRDVSTDGLGLFVRVRRARLRHQSEFLIGAQRVRFDDSSGVTGEAKTKLAARLANGSLPGESVPVEGIACASLSVVTKPHLPRLWLLGGEYWIGRAPDCSIAIVDDLFLAPHHARFTKLENGQWQATSDRSPNGMWIRVSSINVKNTCTFQIGEQRMRLSIL